MKEEELFEKSKSVSGLILGVATYTSSSILGPLLVFGILGYFLDKWTGKNPLFLLLGILLAFISTNILIYKKTKRLTVKFDEYYNKKKAKKSGEKQEIEK